MTHHWRDIHDRHVEGPFLQTRPEQGIAYFRQATPCTRCDGRGSIRGATCPRCDGFRQVTQLRRAFTKPLVHAVRVRHLRMTLARQNRQADSLIAQMARFEEENEAELAILRDASYRRVSRNLNQLRDEVEQQRFITDEQRRRVWALRDEAEEAARREQDRIREQEERRRRADRERLERNRRRRVIEVAERHRMSEAPHVGQRGERHTFTGRVVSRNQFDGLAVIEQADGSRIRYQGRSQQMRAVSLGDHVSFVAMVDLHTSEPAAGRDGRDTFRMFETPLNVTEVQRPTRVQITEGTRSDIPGALGEDAYNWALYYARQRYLLTDDMLPESDDE